MYEQAKERVRGLVLNQPTPFKPTSYEIDHQGLRDNIEFWIAQGVQVLLITIGTSDFFVLSDDEILEVTRTTVEAAQGRAFVIACTHQWWLGQTIEFAQQCEKLGADALMVVKHEPDNATPEDFGDFHRAIYDACKIPLVYHSYLTGPRSAEVIRRVAEVPSLIAIKQELHAYRQYSLLRDTLEDRWAIIAGGGGELAYHAHQFGAVASLTGTGQFAPPQALDFVHRMDTGNWAGARAFLDRIAPYRRLATRIGSHTAIKQAMDLAGLVGGPARPLYRRKVTAEDKEQLTTVLYETGLLKDRQNG